MIGVIGAGAFGTALAIALVQGGARVTLWARNPDQVAAMRRTRVNVHLPGIALPEGLMLTSDASFLAGAKAVLVALPMQQISAGIEPLLPHLGQCPLIACAKGVDLATGRGPVALLSGARPGATTALLTGPSFAADIARGLPTALTLACADDATGAQLQALLSTPVLRLYRSTDTVGAEWGGALKNVIAIAAGVVVGAGLGDSARAALMTRGYAEMQRLALAHGARAETLAGLSGFGDLVLTCTSSQSRNFRHGQALGAGLLPDPGQTVEGVATARAVTKLAKAEGIDMPITAMVAALLDAKITVTEAGSALLSRPLTTE